FTLTPRVDLESSGASCSVSTIWVYSRVLTGKNESCNELSVSITGRREKSWIRAKGFRSVSMDGCNGSWKLATISGDDRGKEFKDGPAAPGKRIEEASNYFMHAPLGSGGYSSVGRALLWSGLSPLCLFCCRGLVHRYNLCDFMLSLLLAERSRIYM
ncbi:hypothetical protein HAX54_009135, partial [Datura stramonium]|nr:hypothetical protein [Datura stramonium]